MVVVRANVQGAEVEGAVYRKWKQIPKGQERSSRRISATYQPILRVVVDFDAYMFRTARTSTRSIGHSMEEYRARGDLKHIH